MGVKLRNGHGIIKNKGSISVTNTKEYRIDTTISRSQDKAYKSGKEVETQIKVHKNSCSSYSNCGNCNIKK